jgi:hypothetical protein
MCAKPPQCLKGFLSFSQHLERTGRNKNSAILSIEFQVLHQLLMQDRCHTHLCRFVAANLQHLFGCIHPLDDKPIPQKRHQETARSTGKFQGDPAILTKALVEKGLIPEWFLTEPEIIALGGESAPDGRRISRAVCRIDGMPGVRLSNPQDSQQQWLITH